MRLKVLVRSLLDFTMILVAVVTSFKVEHNGFSMERGGAIVVVGDTTGMASPNTMPYH